MRTTARGAMRRFFNARVPEILAAMRQLVGHRRTQALPSALTSTRSTSELMMPKPTPANLRRFAETPVARKAINTIKDRIACMSWVVQPREKPGTTTAPAGEDDRIRTITSNLHTPNHDDSFRSLAEQVLEDVIVGGFGAIEIQLTGEAQRPVDLYPVDGSTIRMRSDWDGRPDSPRYAQITGRIGPEATIALNDDELSYIRLNPRTHTPFGLGRLEVAFETINSLLGANRFAAKLASNSVVQYALWIKGLAPAHHERLIRWWQDDIEGTGRVPILSIENKPEVLRFAGGTDADLRLGWQEFLMRIIADAFDLPPLLLGIESDVNRSTAREANDLAFRQAIVPTARLFSEHITRDVLAKRLGWHDLEFVFTDVDARDERELAEIHEILIRSGVMSVAEVRKMRGLQ